MEESEIKPDIQEKAESIAENASEQNINNEELYDQEVEKMSSTFSIKKSCFAWKKIKMYE